MYLEGFQVILNVFPQNYLNHSESIDMHIEKFKFQVLLKQGRSSINITINQAINLSIYKPINPVRVSQGGYEDLSI